MGGEYLDAVEVEARGLRGDRWFAVEDAAGSFACGKNTRRFCRHDEVFDYAARTQGEDVVVARGPARWCVGNPDLDEALSIHLGELVRVRPEASVLHQDAAPVSLVGTATLVWCAQRWGIDADPRRLRVNLVLETDEPFIEETWVGSGMSIGSTEFEVTKRVERCRTIDLAQDGVDGSTPWLKPLGTERDVSVAIYASVSVSGMVSVGDRVTVRQR